MPYADHDGIRIHYHVEGSGPPLVLHHGYSGSLRHWSMNGYVDALRDEYQIIAVDARGHGESDKPHDVADYALATRSADVLQILDDLGIERALYCGFSMGGNVAYGLLTMHPERIAAAAILGADPSPYDTIEWNRVIAALEQGIDAYVAEPEGARGPYSAEERDYMLRGDPQALIASKRDTRDWSGVADAFARVTTPTLLIGGDRDPIHPLIVQAAESNAVAQLVSLPGLDHVATLRRSDLTLPLVRPFFDQYASNVVLRASET